LGGGVLFHTLRHSFDVAGDLLTVRCSCSDNEMKLTAAALLNPCLEDADNCSVAPSICSEAWLILPELCRAADIEPLN